MPGQRIVRVPEEKIGEASVPSAESAFISLKKKISFAGSSVTFVQEQSRFPCMELNQTELWIPLCSTPFETETVVFSFYITLQGSSDFGLEPRPNDWVSKLSTTAPLAVSLPCGTALSRFLFRRGSEL